MLLLYDNQDQERDHVPILNPMIRLDVSEMVHFYCSTVRGVGAASSVGLMAVCDGSYFSLGVFQVTAQQFNNVPLASFSRFRSRAVRRTESPCSQFSLAENPWHLLKYDEISVGHYRRTASDCMMMGGREGCIDGWAAAITLNALAAGVGQAAQRLCCLFLSVASDVQSRTVADLICCVRVNRQPFPLGGEKSRGDGGAGHRMAR